MTTTTDRPPRGGGPAWRADPGPVTLVWIDSDRAIVGHCSGHETDTLTEVLVSDVPAHHRSTGHIRHDPERHGGGGVAADLIERTREEHLRRFVNQVAERIADEPVEIVGPGTVREHLARRLRERDVARSLARPIATVASGPLTERQFLARLRLLAGRPAPRRRSPS
jgi:hypothetical protein